MASLNKVTIIGNLGQAPEIRHTQDGRAIATISIATSQNWKDKQTGEKRTKTEWHRVVIFNEGLAKIAEKYLKKGSSVYIEGALQTRKWQDKNGVDRWTTEIVLQGFNATLTMLGSKQGQDSGYQSNNQANQQNPATNQAMDDVANYDIDLNDDIPF